MLGVWVCPVSGDDAPDNTDSEGAMKYTIIAPAYNEAENVEPLDGQDCRDHGWCGRAL